jgi:catechol 2,3-dioxygenase-like lactoylglutathione lyase family enzyme
MNSSKAYWSVEACRISELVIDCRDPQQLAAFWCEVLGFIVLDTEDGAVEIGPREGFGGLQPTLIFSPSTEPKVGKRRQEGVAALDMTSRVRSGRPWAAIDSGNQPMSGGDARFSLARSALCR